MLANTALDNLERQEVECHMTFLGLVVLQNRLKPQSAPAIHCLRLADIRSVMVTGEDI